LQDKTLEAGRKADDKTKEAKAKAVRI
jgi:hypothetical protein